MSEMIDKGSIRVIGHVLIRDPDSDEVILNRRDLPPANPSQTANPQGDSSASE
jgi:hypothetical protein